MRNDFSYSCLLALSSRPKATWSNLRCYEPEEELRENCQVQIAPLDFLDLETRTVFTQLLHGLIESRFIGFIGTFLRHVGFFGLDCTFAGEWSHAPSVDKKWKTQRRRRRRIKTAKQKMAWLDNRTLESLARRSAGRTGERLQRIAKTSLPRNQLGREVECALAMQRRFTSMIIFPCITGWRDETPSHDFV